MAGRTLVVVTILISIFKPNNSLMYTTSPLSARGVLRTLSKQSGGMEAEITLPLPSKKKQQQTKKLGKKLTSIREDTNPGTPDTLTVDRVF